MSAGTNSTAASTPCGSASSIAARVTDGNLAVVTHGLVCHSLAQRQLHVPADVSAPLRWNNASLTVIEPPAPWKVRLLNCVVHLDDDTQTGIV